MQTNLFVFKILNILYLLDKSGKSEKSKGNTENKITKMIHSMECILDHIYCFLDSFKEYKILEMLLFSNIFRFNVSL